MTWTVEKIKKLKKLWQKGQSTVEIAKELGISKNAVVGKVHRLDLEARPSPIKKKVKKVVKPEPVKEKQTSLMDLKLNSCRWPIGDPEDEDFHFCGAEASTGKPYCPEHCKIAYTSLKELTIQNAKAKKEREEEAQAQAEANNTTETESKPETAQEETVTQTPAEKKKSTKVDINEPLDPDNLPILMPIKGKRSEASKRKVTKLQMEIFNEVDERTQAKKAKKK